MSNNREIIFEMHRIGNFVKIVALDVSTLTEISIQMPAGAGETAFKHAATQRLLYVLRKKGLIA